LPHIVPNPDIQRTLSLQTIGLPGTATKELLRACLTKALAGASERCASED